MSLRVVLYAEGTRELEGSERVQLAPGSAIPEDALGPAHHLLRRALEKVRNIPAGAVHFEEPLRTARGKIPRGSDLYHPKTLRQLLSWPDARKRPQLAVVIVDNDGAKERKRELAEAIVGLLVDPIIAVAVQEFESWMIADLMAVRSACRDPSFDAPGDLEALDPRAAKTRFEDAVRGGDPSRSEERERRVSVARTLDLDTVATRCPSFRNLLDALAR